MQKYDFELIYKPGKHLVLANALSRAPVLSLMGSTEKEVENHVNMIMESLPVSDAKSGATNCDRKPPNWLAQRVLSKILSHQI